MKRITVILILLPLCIFGQEKKTVTKNFRSIVGAGIAGGQTGISPVFDLSGGITYSRYFTGIGIGFDSYQFDAFPIFADWRVGFGKKQLLFAYATSGYVIPERHNNEGEPFRVDHMQGGFFFDAGFGYRIPINLMHRISFSAGYRHKALSHQITYNYACGGTPCVEIPPTIYVNHYKYGLITTKLSWELGK